MFIERLNCDIATCFNLTVQSKCASSRLFKTSPKYQYHTMSTIVSRSLSPIELFFRAASATAERQTMYFADCATSI